MIQTKSYEIIIRVFTNYAVFVCDHFIDTTKYIKFLEKLSFLTPVLYLQIKKLSDTHGMSGYDPGLQTRVSASENQFLFIILAAG